MAHMDSRDATLAQPTQQHFGFDNCHAPEPDDIRAARTAAGLTQTEAGAVVHASLRTWQQWEAGDRKMHPGLFELFTLKTARENRKQQASDRNNQE